MTTKKGTESKPDPRMKIQRIQTGVRMEKRMIKVLKALAEYLDMTLGDLLEGIVLYAFEGKGAFCEETLARIDDLKKIYNMDYDSGASHCMFEEDPHSAKGD